MVAKSVDATMTGLAVAAPVSVSARSAMQAESPLMDISYG